MEKRKLFVLDTNVILHDHHCIYNFQNNDIALPISVLEELDHFKKGQDQISFNARDFIRILDALAEGKVISRGIRIGKDRGRISIITNHQFEKPVTDLFSEDRVDHRILSVAHYLTRSHPDIQVILVSKDVNLRLKAKSIGLDAQDYFTDKIKDLSILYTGKRLMKNIPVEQIDQLYISEEPLPAAQFPLSRLVPNQYLILKNNKKSALASYCSQTDSIRRVPKSSAYGIMPRNAEQTFAIDGLLNGDISLMTLAGKSGTGKTLLALASALEVRTRYRQIYLARPIIPLSNRDIGYLPGGIEEKIDPYMQPLYDNLAVIKNQYRENEKLYRRITDMLKNQKLVISPLAYIRGRSLENIFFIVDEAQNLTPHEIKTIITRAGENTKVVFTGDPYQIDHPYLDSRSNGLTYLIDRMKGQPIYGHITLEKGERSYLSELASNLL